MAAHVDDLRGRVGGDPGRPGAAPPVPVRSSTRPTSGTRRWPTCGSAASCGPRGGRSRSARRSRWARTAAQRPRGRGDRRDARLELRGHRVVVAGAERAARQAVARLPRPGADVTPAVAPGSSLATLDPAAASAPSWWSPSTTASPAGTPCWPLPRHRHPGRCGTRRRPRAATSPSSAAARAPRSCSRSPPSEALRAPTSSSTTGSAPYRNCPRSAPPSWSTSASAPATTRSPSRDRAS